ncbi:MAG: hypothetical protein QOJ29_5302, partial [Thermoleophilaceae bacterium]|nr:hypothetical protein [Thermoleophilaceae bacterium]
PDGKLVSKQVKTYLTPSEVGRPEGQVAALDFVPGSITSGLSAVPTPVGTLGFVTSKDAWMPDVIDRLEAQGVDLLLQPEFFAGDLATTEGMWSTDTLKASGYSDLLRHPGFQSFALAEAVGNVFDFSADQQSHIAIRSAKPGGGKWLLGQPPSPGLVGVTPWVVPDPARRGELTAERRKRLGEAGKKLMPGSKVKCADPAKPGPCENGHVEGVLWRDVPVGVPDAPASKVKLMRRRFSAAQPLATGTSPERNAAIAAAGKWVAVVFEQERPEGARVMVAVSQDSGSHWDPATEVAPAAPGDQWWPAVAITRDGAITVAWTASAPARVVFAQGRGAAFGAPQPIDPSAPADLAQWKPALALGSGGVVHAAFVDARTRSADAGLPQAGIYYTRIKAGIPDAAKRLDGGTPAPLAAKMDNAWSPALAVRGSRVLATWLDFTNYDWDVFSRESSDGGDSFDRALDANPEPADIEDLSDSPKPVLTARASFLTWTDFHKRPSVKAPHPLYDIYLAQRDKPPLQADPYGARQVSTVWPSACADGRDILVAFQDSATGVAHIRITRIKRGAKRGHAFVVDNSSAAAYRPALACSGRRAIAAWEDARGGPPRIYSAFAGTSRIR